MHTSVCVCEQMRLCDANVACTRLYWLATYSNSVIWSFIPPSKESIDKQTIFPTNSEKQQRESERKNTVAGKYTNEQRIGFYLFINSYSSFCCFIFIFEFIRWGKEEHLEMRVRSARCNLQDYKYGEKRHMLASCVLLAVKSNCSGIIHFSPPYEPTMEIRWTRSVWEKITLNSKHPNRLLLGTRCWRVLRRVFIIRTSPSTSRTNAPCHIYAPLKSRSSENRCSTW